MTAQRKTLADFKQAQNVTEDLRGELERVRHEGSVRADDAGERERERVENLQRKIATLEEERCSDVCYLLQD